MVTDTPETSEARRIRQTAELMGGYDVLGRRIANGFDVHDLLVEGWPAQALRVMLEKLGVLGADAGLADATGLSNLLAQSFTAVLTVEQGVNAWRLGAVLTQAADVFGSLCDAEIWLTRRQYLLQDRRPIDLLVSEPGSQLVVALLSAIEYDCD
ncbi:MAG: antitoxin Xre/MbcA/ParS toxin-binding domain-containing protein [Devosia sp.]